VTQWRECANSSMVRSGSAYLAVMTRRALPFVAMAVLGCGSESDSAAVVEASSAATSSAVAINGTALALGDGTASAEQQADNAEEVASALRGEDTPIVDLAGIANLRPPRDPSRPALASIARLTPVHARPDIESPRIGFLRAGAAVSIDPTEIPPNAKCSGGWRKITPAGYVCLGDRATLDLEHAIVRASHRRPDTTEKLPYMYGVVTRGGPVYARVPTAEHLDEFEPNLAKHISKWKKDEVSGATYGLDVWLKWTTEDKPSALDAWDAKTTDEAIPWYLSDGGSVPNLSGRADRGSVKIGQVDRRQGVAFIDSFLHEGRRYNVSTDLRIIPADRFRPIRGSDFHGWQVGVELEFPFALVRRAGGKRWIWSASKKRMVGGESLEWRSAWELTGKQKFYKKRLHYETKEGFWIDDRHGGRVDLAKRMPKWAKNGERWIDINLTKQVLVAYEGEKAVYTTLVSSGEGGLGDPAESRSTIRGIFRIHTKHISVTMDSDDVGEEFELRDVPYVQYFKDGYALHGAYWHDGFGRPKSHGCINLSPEDARRIFWWTGPHVPPGWHGAAANLTGTVVFVHP